MKFSRLNLALSILFFGVLSIPLWLKLDVLSIRLWDEARNAVNAAEMAQTGNLLVRTFNFEPETYNLKPPLLTWLQAFFIKVLGYNELAIRLPSVIASILSLWLVFKLVFSFTKNHASSILAVGITATASGFYGEHVGRFGDHDALLVTLCLWLVYEVFKYVQSGRAKFLYWSAFAVFLGVMCKSISILLLLPGLVLAILIYRKLIPALKDKSLWFGVVGVVALIAAYYGIRNFLQPDYLYYVWNDELFPRYLNTSKNLSFREEGPFYYINQLTKHQMNYGIWGLLLIPLGLYNKTTRKPTLAILFVILSFLAIISKGTHNFWYVAPAIPLIAVVVGLSFYALLSVISIKQFSWLMVFVLLYMPFKRTHKHILNTSEPGYAQETYGISYYLRDKSRAQKLPKSTKIVLDSVYGFEPHLFYVRKLNHLNSLELPRYRLNKLENQDTVLISHHQTYQALKLRYTISVLDEMPPTTKLLAIHKKREP
jgi:4-amino-4-deoxy-L-arabinose transferase-like glycosyltransferase